MDHALECRECRRAAAAAELVPPEVLDCADCRESLDFLWALLDDLEHFEPAVARELPRAERFLEELSRLPPAEQVLEVTSGPRYQEWGFCQWLLMSSRAGWHGDIRLARHRAGLAVAIAERLDPRYYHPRWLADLQGKAYSYLANTHRILGDFDQAQRNMHEAKRRVRRGVGGDAEPRVLCLESTLVGDMGDVDGALLLLDRAEPHFLAAGSSRDLVGIALKRSGLFAHSQRLLLAFRECQHAASLIQPRQEPTLSAMAHQNMASILTKLGQTQRGRKVLDELKPNDEGSIVAHRLWINANLCRAEGQRALALRFLKRARHLFLELGRRPDAEAVTRDMALVDQPPWITPAKT